VSEEWDSLEVPSGPESGRCLATWTEQFQLYLVSLRERGRPLSGPGEAPLESKRTRGTEKRHPGKTQLNSFYIGYIIERNCTGWGLFRWLRIRE